MKDLIAGELYTLVGMLKERATGVSIPTILQLVKVDELLDGRDDIAGAERLRAICRPYREALEADHSSVEITVDLREARVAAEEALAARNAALPVDEQVHGAAHGSTTSARGAKGV
jgi:hypothetical protein